LAESTALERIHKAVPGLVPKPICHSPNKTALIVTEYVPMSTSYCSSPTIQKQLGRSLAALHATSTSDKFGFDVTSWCGTTELNNTWCSDWSQFYASQRLQPLLKQVQGQNLDVDRLGKALCSNIDRWLGHDALGSLQASSCIHGDLWSGNWAVRASDTQPIIFDPASFYAHYETEFGIMRMFGGFTQDCYEAYEDALLNQYTSSNVKLAPEESKEDRLIIYEAYHHLNHYAMFGGGYAAGFVNLIEKLL
jgi:protein-ribulosamine 3-kinase